MPQTFGDIRFYLSKIPCGAGIDLDVLSQIVNDRYQGILSSYAWSRLRASTVITAVELYETGTVEVTEGDTTLTLTSGTWTAAMDGRLIRVAGRQETYTFAYLTASTGTLSAPYEGETDTAASYKIFQNIFSLPADVSQIQSVTIPFNNMELDPIERETLDEIAPDRETFGRPEVYALGDDAGSGSMQIELYPIPEIAESYPVRYIRKVARIENTSEQFLPWVNTDCLLAGCEADLLRLKGDYNGYSVGESRYQMLLADMQRRDVERKTPTAPQMADRFTIHRDARAIGTSRHYRHWQTLRNSN